VVKNKHKNEKGDEKSTIFPSAFIAAHNTVPQHGVIQSPLQKHPD